MPEFVGGRHRLWVDARVCRWTPASVGGRPRLLVASDDPRVFRKVTALASDENLWFHKVTALASDENLWVPPGVHTDP